MKQPLVSVIIPTCNNKESLVKSIDSVFAQTYSDFEIIIVDDASDDGTFEVVQEVYNDKDNLIYVFNDVRAGFCECCNVGSTYASGDYIAFLTSDAVWTQDKLEKQLIELGGEYSWGNVVYGCVEKNFEDKVIWKNPDPRINRELCLGYMHPFLLMFPIVDISSLMLKRSIFEELGGMHADLGKLADYEFIIRLAKYYGFDFVDAILVKENKDIREDSQNVEETIFTQCYITGINYRELIEYGMLEEKLDEIARKANASNLQDMFLNCLVALELPQIDQYVARVKLKSKSSKVVQVFEENTIAKVQDCCGCMSCVNACKVGAIEMVLDEEGFLTPQIDEARCVGCGQCKMSCPLCNDVNGVRLPEKCFAVMAKDEVRMNSSSGGIFPLLAESILQDGGYVAGAVFDEDLSVKHILSNDILEVKKMYTSKYVQSYIGGVFAEIEEVLKSEKKVLFSGCACQTAGLRQYLKEDYPNLYVVDVVCHGVPSTGVYENYVKEKGPLQAILFRDKEKLGWGSGMVIKHADETEQVFSVGAEPYMTAFLNNWTLRNSCYECQFKDEKYSDITLGDFWGINQIGTFEDGLGSSFVTLNTSKGVALFGSIINQIKNSAQTDTKLAIKYNPCIASSVKRNKLREAFFECYNKDSLQSTIDKMKQAIKFDAALIYMWANNYGNALTNYALYTYLSNQGLKLLALDNMSTLRPEKDMLRFAREHYNLSSDYFNEYAYSLVNDCCERFIVGSDQNWNYVYERAYKYGRYFQLDFVKPEKKKYSYATSFGMPQAAIPKELGEELYQQFNAISVREDFGIDVCRDLYGVEAVRVMDPVFLLDAKEYDDILTGEQLECKEPYILVYILNPTYEKIQLCKEIQRRLNNIRIINILDNNSINVHYNKKIFNYENIVSSPTVETWLNYIKNSSFVITDSYHGMCFSIIYRKPFVTIKNRERYRFATFERYPVFAERILDNLDKLQIDKWAMPLDYAQVEDELNDEIVRSKQFICDYILK